MEFAAEKWELCAWRSTKSQLSSASNLRIFNEDLGDPTRSSGSDRFSVNLFAVAKNSLGFQKRRRSSPQSIWRLRLRHYLSATIRRQQVWHFLACFLHFIKSSQTMYEFPGRCFRLFLLFYSILHTTNGQYNPQTYPDPRIDPASCKVLFPSQVCDPSEILNPDQRAQLNEKIQRLQQITANIRNTSPPCVGSQQSNLYVMIALMVRILLLSNNRETF
jgi:hypothetical protein